MGSGGFFPRRCTNLFIMNFEEILAPVIEFFSDGIGAIIASFGEILYNLSYPSNADPATPIEIPD